MKLACLLLLASATAHAGVAIVDATGAATSIAHGAVVLDARGASDFRRGHIPSAVRVDWKDFRDGWGRTGRLSDDDTKLAQQLGALGIDDACTVLVYGKGKAGFGEEGRIAWMLAYLGHDAVQLLDGAWSGPLETRTTPPVARRPTIRRDARLRVDLATFAAAQRSHGTILDIRTDEEWHGATPYLEARGGHVPGATLVPFASLFDGAGRLDRAAVTKRLQSVPRDRPVYVYCTGGVRSALATVLLRALGWDAKNFDASFWAWAADGDLPVEK